MRSCPLTAARVLQRTQTSVEQAAICAAKKHGVSGQVRLGPSSYAVFEVTFSSPAIQPTFAPVEERAKTLLANQAHEQAMNKFTEEAQARWKARTECAAGHQIDLCSEYRPPEPLPPARRGTR